jgi:O-glycosyl hydrolase
VPDENPTTGTKKKMAQSIGSIHRCIEQLPITQIQEHISHNQESKINFTFLTIKNKFLTISSPSVPNPRTHIHHHPYTKNQEHISQSHHHASDNNTERPKLQNQKSTRKREYIVVNPPASAPTAMHTSPIWPPATTVNAAHHGRPPATTPL